MMTTELEQPEEIVTYDENILSFLDYTVLILSQANSANDVDIIMDDFLSDDFIDILSNDRDLFGMLAPIWMDVFSRVFVTSDETSFSLKSLWIPVLINKLNWTIENKSTVSDLHKFCLEKVKKESSLYNYLSLLFVEGVLFTPDSAFNNFKLHTESLIKSQNDANELSRLHNDIISLGWT